SPHSALLSSPGGKVLRLIPNRDPDGSGYDVPPDNPFVDDPTANPLVASFGIRSPWRGTIDRHDGIIIADVGANTFEEINRSKGTGENFGFPDSEGECTEDCDGVTQPITYYGRSNDDPYAIDDPDTEPSESRTIWVGGPYHTGKEDPHYQCGLNDAVLFGDFF